MEDKQIRRFRKKPVVIEAIQYDGTDEGYAAVCAFAPGIHFEPCGNSCFKVPTLEGEYIASPGDWIIRGIKGELYPCKPDIFAATYEEVFDGMSAEVDKLILKTILDAAESGEDLPKILDNES